MGYLRKIWRTSRGISKTIVGSQVTTLDIIKSKRALKRIQKSNEYRKGLTHYKLSDIEPFIEDKSGVIQNVIVSGMNHEIRNRVITAALANAYDCGYHTVVLHNSNKELEQRIVSGFGSANVLTINSNCPLYDPIIRLSNSEISNLIIQTAPKDCEIASVGKYYIEGMVAFLRSKGRVPCTSSCLSCPHHTLLDIISDAEAKGKITSSDAQSITSRIVQGSTERANIETYFSMLHDQAYQLLAPKKNISNAMTLRDAVEQYPISVFDIVSDSNTLLINLLAYEISLLHLSGKKTVLVVDGLQFSSNEKLQKVILNSGGNLYTVLSEDDFFASSGGNENTFFSLAGKATIIVLCRHSSAYSCQKWSDVIGSYDKQEVSTSISHGFGMWTPPTANVEMRRENVVKPEEINKLKPSEIYIINRTIGELAHTMIRT